MTSIITGALLFLFSSVSIAQTKKETIKVGDFSKISMSIPADVELTQGSKTELIIEDGNNMPENKNGSTNVILSRGGTSMKNACGSVVINTYAVNVRKSNINAAIKFMIFLTTWLLFRMKTFRIALTIK